MLENLTPPARKGRCAFTRFRETLDSHDVQILDDAMADQNWTTHGLAIALRDRGAPLTYQTVYRHRTNTCACKRRGDADVGQPATG